VEPQNPADAQLRKDGVQCAWTLRQLGVAQQAYFPDGLEKAKPFDLTGEGVNWPPPKTYGWRVSILPPMEEASLYKFISQSSNGFKIPGTLSEAELVKHPALKDDLDRMPKWFSLDKWNAKPSLSIYRRVAFQEKPTLFILVESSELVPWFRGSRPIYARSGAA